MTTNSPSSHSVVGGAHPTALRFAAHGQDAVVVIGQPGNGMTQSVKIVRYDAERGNERTSVEPWYTS